MLVKNCHKYHFFLIFLVHLPSPTLLAASGSLLDFALFSSGVNLHVVHVACHAIIQSPDFDSILVRF